MTESRLQPEWSCISRGLLNIFRCNAGVIGGKRGAGFRALLGDVLDPKMVPKGSNIDLKSVFANLVKFARRAGHSSVLKGRGCPKGAQQLSKIDEKT